jgi:TRAP-type mannitol/chloroaromatic compound transport system permease large subunit
MDMPDADGNLQVDDAPHVTLNQIFIGMMPFMAIQVLAIFLLYMFPQIGLWVPSLVYK